MRMLMSCVIAAASLFGSIALAANSEPKSEDQKTFYAIGILISNSLSTFDLSESELEMVKAGLTDGALHKKPKVDAVAYRTKIQALHQARLTAIAEREKKAGKAFMEKMAKEKGVTKTASGMLYAPIKVGSGASPTATDSVKVHYNGTLIDGSVFDSSVQRGQPATFRLNQVIRCWTEGLQLMKVGGKGKFVCPSELAYGDHGRPPKIPPGATLVFEVELLDIVKQ